MNLTRTICLWILVIAPGALLAQSFQADTSFFRSQLPAYQRWLDREGLGTYLQVHDLTVADDYLVLYLVLPYQQVADDSARLDRTLAAWKLLQQYRDSVSALSLEIDLLYQLSFLMEADLEQVYIQVYDTYDLDYEHQFLRYLYFREGQVKARVKGEMRSEIVKISLPSPQETGRPEARLALDQGYSSAEVFQGIEAYVRTRFTNPDCTGRVPDLEILDDQEAMHFRVWNLCREVLHFMDRSDLCAFLDYIGFECDWAKRERLDFKITYSPLAEGAELTLVIDGKIGSGLYEEDRRGGYYNMEDDFDEAFESYAASFKRDLRSFLIDYLAR